MQNAFFDWFLPRNALEAMVKSLIVTIFIVLANIGFAEVYLGYQPVDFKYLVLNIIVVASPWFCIFMMAMYRQRRTEERLLRLSRRDGLTGLLNRNSFLEEVQSRANAGASGVLLMVDADHFKAINDRLGHRAGDACLRNIARRLSNTLRGRDISGRMGGEEFAIFLEAADLPSAKQAAERLLHPIHFRETEGTDENCVTLSIGATALPAYGDVEQHLSFADKALYAAKRAGRACLGIWDSVEGAATTPDRRPEIKVVQ